MTQQKVRDAFARNRWLRWQAYLAIVMVANAIRLIVTWPAPATWWSALPAPVLFTASVACMAMAFRLSAVQRQQREVEDREAAELRTPRAPDAGPDQCPVCGAYGLHALAKDDAFMDRGERAKVVTWGRKRAHRDCAEFVPYVAPPHAKLLEIDGHRVYCACDEHADAFTRSGAFRRCRFCGFYRRAETVEAAKAELLAHVKECPKRPGVGILADKSYREGGVVLNPGRVFLGADGEAYEARLLAEIRRAAEAPCRPTSTEVEWRAQFAESADVDALIAGVEMRVRRIQTEMDAYMRPNLKGQRR